MEFKRLPDPRRRAETKRFFHEASLSYGTNKGGRKFWRTRKGKQASLAFWAVEEAYKEHPSASKAFIKKQAYKRGAKYGSPFTIILSMLLSAAFKMAVAWLLDQMYPNEED